MEPKHSAVVWQGKRTTPLTHVVRDEFFFCNRSHQLPPAGLETLQQAARGGSPATGSAFSQLSLFLSKAESGNMFLITSDR